MRYLFFLTFLLTAHDYVNAQQNHTLFATYSISGSTPLYHKRLEGGGSYKAATSHSFGVRHIIKGSRMIGLETGLEFARYQFDARVSPLPLPEVYARQTVSMISIPVYANLTFMKYLFVNGGLLVDAEFDKQKNSIDKQSGIGFGLGLGARYTHQKLAVFINPFLERHAFVPFQKERGTRQSIINSGIRVGVGYSF